ncbi:MAG: GerMN domain-containing protein [Proteobacteria bacterium]|nr:GerMN domain-containing protein [Pseudomonadota bacterium]
MATKRKKRTSTIKSKKRKKNLRLFLLSVIITIAVGCLFFFFVTLFDSVYPPTTGKGVSVKKKEKQKVVLYFSDSNERFLVPEKRYIPKKKSINDQAKELVMALVEGPKTGLVKTFPGGTQLKSVKMGKSGTAYVSFGKNLLELHPGGSASEMATIYSLTNTLMSNIPDIKRVKILIEGKKLRTIRGHIDTSRSFILNRELIAQGSAGG